MFTWTNFITEKRKIQCMKMEFLQTKGYDVCNGRARASKKK